MSLAPDYVAIRGAVCGGDRHGVVRQHLVEQFVRPWQTALRPGTAGIADRARHLGTRGGIESVGLLDILRGEFDT